jgi:hypothetical protein
MIERVADDEAALAHQCWQYHTVGCKAHAKRNGCLLANELRYKRLKLKMHRRGSCNFAGSTSLRSSAPNSMFFNCQNRRDSHRWMTSSFPGTSATRRCSYTAGKGIHEINCHPII